MPHGDEYDKQINSDIADTKNVAEFDRCLEMFDGNDEAAVAAARRPWRECGEAGPDLTYWQQIARGGWRKEDG